MREQAKSHQDIETALRACLLGISVIVKVIFVLVTGFEEKVNGDGFNIYLTSLGSGGY